MPTISTLELLETNGYAAISGVLSHEQVQQVTQEISNIEHTAASTRKMLDLPWCGKLADTLGSDPRLNPALPLDARAVQCTLFVKTVETTGWFRFIRI
jgi:hypothetical protein